MELPPDIASQADQINASMHSDIVSYADRRERQRIIADAQVKSSEVACQISTAIAASTPKEVQDWINGLRDTQPAVHKYVRDLQTLKYNIWCPVCDKNKKIGGRDPADIEADVQSEVAGVDARVNVKKVIPEAERKAPTPYVSGPRVPALTSALLLTEPPMQPIYTQAAYTQQLAYTEFTEPARITDVPNVATQQMQQTSHSPSDITARIEAIRELRDEVRQYRDDLTEKLRKIDAFIATLEPQQPHSDWDDIIARSMHDNAFRDVDSYGFS